MTPIEALQALLDGKAIRGSCWDPGCYVRFAAAWDGRPKWYHTLLDERGEVFEYDISDFVSEDPGDPCKWELYEGAITNRVEYGDFWIPVSETEAVRRTFKVGQQPDDAAWIHGTHRVEWEEVKECVEPTNA